MKSQDMSERDLLIELHTRMGVVEREVSQVCKQARRDDDAVGKVVNGLKGEVAEVKKKTHTLEGRYKEARGFVIGVFIMAGGNLAVTQANLIVH